MRFIQMTSYYGIFMSVMKLMNEHIKYGNGFIIKLLASSWGRYYT